MHTFKLEDEHYGELLPFIRNENVTDINWNGVALWIDDLKKGRYVSSLKLSEDFVTTFCNRLANVISVNFNKYYPVLEAETENLRISAIHESVTCTGTTISIRSTPPIIRASLIGDMHDFFKAAIEAKSRIIIAGETGAGKTELLKCLTQYIPSELRAVTIEDTLEIRYREINPDKDSFGLRVNEEYTYTDALKNVLRQNVKYILLSEARSVEVKSLFENLSNGSSCITTIHTDKVSNIPDRLYNMFPAGEDYGKIINLSHQFLDIGVLVEKHLNDEGAYVREITEVALFDRSQNQNTITMIYQKGGFLNVNWPIEFMERLRSVGYQIKKAGRR